MLLLLFSGLYSCSDEALSDNDAHVTQQSLEKRDSRTFNESLDHPVLTAGAYTFRDSTHFADYYAVMYRLYNEDAEAFKHYASVDLSSNNYRHPGYLTIAQRRYNDTFPDFDQRFISHLYDPILETVVNLNYEVVIGDLRAVYVNGDQVLMMDRTDDLAREKVANLTKGVKYSIAELPEGVAWGDTEHGVEAFLFKPCGCSLSIKRSTSDCNEFIIKGACKNWRNASGGGEVVIEVYPFPVSTIGQTLYQQTSDVDGNFDFRVDATGWTGSIRIVASADPDCLTGATQDRAEVFDLDKGACDRSQRMTSVDRMTDNYSQSITYKTRYWINWFGTGNENAEMWAWWRTNHFSNQWHRTDGTMTATIDATRRNLVCDELGTESETRSCNSCHELHANVNSLRRWHCDDDVKGDYLREFNWNGSQWAISAAQTVDFECCN